jgi:hypothetical protein
MDMLRFLGLAALMFAAAFLGMNWYLRVEPVKPDPRMPTFERVDADSPASKLAKSSISDGDVTRDRCATKCSITPRRSVTIRAIRR